MTTSVRRESEGDRGAAAVEFALILPILVLILLGIMEFGFIFNTQISLTQAVREGVRVEALETDEGVTTTEAAFHPMIVDTAGLSVAPPTGCGDGAERAEIQATYSYDFVVFPFMDFAFGNDTLDLSAEAVMRCGG